MHVPELQVLLDVDIEICFWKKKSQKIPNRTPLTEEYVCLFILMIY